MWCPFQNDIPPNNEGCVAYTADRTENTLTGSVANQFYWKNKGNIFQLEVEEIRDCEKPNLNDDHGCKYIHTIYNKVLSQFIHLDGAIRKFDLDAIINRQSVLLTKAAKNPNIPNYSEKMVIFLFSCGSELYLLFIHTTSLSLSILSYNNIHCFTIFLI